MFHRGWSMARQPSCRNLLVLLPFTTKPCNFLKVSLSAAKLMKFCLPWICVYKCPLTNLPALSQSCLPCLAEQGVMCWLGAPQGQPGSGTAPWYGQGLSSACLSPRPRWCLYYILYSAVHSRPKYVWDNFPTAKFDWDWRKERKNDIEQHSHISLVS